MKYVIEFTRCAIGFVAEPALAPAGPPLHQSYSAWSCCVAIPGSLLASLVQRGSTDCEDDGAPPRPLGCEALPFAFVEVGCNARFCPRVVACRCVGCTGHKVGMQFSNEVIDVLDLIFSVLNSEFLCEGAVLPKLEQSECRLRTLQA